MDGMQQRIVNDELHLAVDRSLSELEKRIDLCLSKGADINSADANGNTVLMKAVAQRNTGLVRFLLKKNPDVLIENKKSLDVFEIARALHENGEYFRQNKHNITDMLLAALPDKSPEAARARRVVERQKPADPARPRFRL